MTRRFYIKLSKVLWPHQNALKWTLLGIFSLGFGALLVFAALAEHPSPTAISVVGRLWFSGCAIIGICYFVCGSFHPDEDPKMLSTRKDGIVIGINLALIVALWTWTWSE